MKLGLRSRIRLINLGIVVFVVGVVVVWMGALLVDALAFMDGYADALIYDQLTSR